MIKICFVDEDGRFGGPQVRMIETFKKVERKKFKITFLIPKKITIFKKKLLKLKAPIDQINLSILSSKFRFLIKYIFFFPKELFTLVRYFKNNKFDIIQANGAPHFKTIIAARIANIPSIWILEDTFAPKILVLIFQFIANLFNPKIVYISKRVFNFYLKEIVNTLCA